jgi:hypothetical protein
MASRAGQPPSRHASRNDEAAVIPAALPVPCRVKARDHAHRWYLPASYLEDWCEDEHVRLEDVRPWARRASDGKVVLARHWGLPDFEVDDFGRPSWLARLRQSGRRKAIA